ncbi:MAG TPA: TIGR04282 family arsenosugar biosynthesis glycosyltransferase [Acetobacteraceae bacterium]|nr:TIGR04282 family arsenosugar biosynthesis glycosyltransferase [Acetobacteraceae bacterium]
MTHIDGRAGNAGRCAIAVMAKAPRPGRVKTRLSPPLSPDEAMAMGAAFLRDVTANLRCAARDAPIAGFVAYAPAGSDSLFDGLLAPDTGLVLADGTGAMPDTVQGFGRSLLHATRALFDRGFGAVCVLNADSPTLPTDRLIEAATALLRPGPRAVLGPAEDGGYYLLGMQTPDPHLFSAIDWSTDRVAVQTRTRIAERDLPLVDLPPWYDVDDGDALTRLLRELAAPGAGFAAPATRACIARLGLDRHHRARMEGALPPQ